jgi:hypothetical protein
MIVTGELHGEVAGKAVGALDNDGTYAVGAQRPSCLPGMKPAAWLRTSPSCPSCCVAHRAGLAAGDVHRPSRGAGRVCAADGHARCPPRPASVDDRALRRTIQRTTIHYPPPVEIERWTSTCSTGASLTHFAQQAVCRSPPLAQ